MIDLAAAGRGIRSVRDADELQRDVKGEVAAVSSHHALVKLSDDVAVRFKKDSLDRDVKAGDKVQSSMGKKKVRFTSRAVSPRKHRAISDATWSVKSGQSQLLLAHADGMQVGAVECRFIRSYPWFEVVAGRS